MKTKQEEMLRMWCNRNNNRLAFPKEKKGHREERRIRDEKPV
jgi:hypothetical protein